MLIVTNIESDTLISISNLGMTTFKFDSFNDRLTSINDELKSARCEQKQAD